MEIYLQITFYDIKAFESADYKNKTKKNSKINPISLVFIQSWHEKIL